MLSRANRPNAACFAYYHNILLQDYGGAPVIGHLAITEYVVIALLGFQSIFRDGAVFVACIDSLSAIHGRGGLVLLPSGVRREVDDNGLRTVLLGSSLILSPLQSPIVGYSRLFGPETIQSSVCNSICFPQGQPQCSGMAPYVNKARCHGQLPS